MQRFFKIFSRLPLGLAQALGGLLGWCVFVASSTYRRRFLVQARQAGLGAAQWRPAVAAAGQLVAELPRLWLGAPVPVQWVGQAHVEAALLAGRGVVFLTPHLGCFEIAAQAYADRFGVARPMTVLFRPPRQAWLREWVNRARSRPGLLTAATSQAGVRQLLRALKPVRGSVARPSAARGAGPVAAVFRPPGLHHDAGGATGPSNRCLRADGLG